MPQQSMISLILPFVLFMGVLYIFIILPDKKRKKQYNTMLEGLRVNDEVITRGGIIGKITRIQDEFIIIESGPDKVKVKLSKNGIATTTSALKEDK
ncbi:preprotein translocase subunit YajC [Clostridium sp. MB40-C1]|uniref:preprotein translocase subunit YajC n=1 Tax=Clostridium sp. MB40-C1 TaxID=3070996 RepID=UPI0027DF0A8B|nr:preprotein translocase subunit YajC [Clostridium sp. MB40-C1]WMJ81266.1 preprotein translocase subunit YajC [Clostridium sp. MB40-C1]